jgi:hypothetical protein
MTLEQEVIFWREKYQRQYASWLSLRTLYNKTIREYDHPEIRLLRAKLHDKANTTLGA